MNAWLLLLSGIAAGFAVLAWNGGRGDRGAVRGPWGLLGFILLAVGMTSPLALHPTRMMLTAGAGPDAFIGLWNIWWTRVAVFAAANPFVTDWIYAPQGTILALHTYSLTYGLASLPVQVLFADLQTPPGLFAVYNLIVIASFTLAGWITYRLALSLTGHRGAALLAGILFAFAHYRFANTVRLHALATEFLVLLVWSFMSLRRDRRPGRLILLVLSAIALLYASPEYAAYGVLLIIVAAAGGGTQPCGESNGRIRPVDSAGTAKASGEMAGRQRSAASGRPVAPRVSWVIAGVGAAVIGLALLLPWIGPFLRRVSEGGIGFDPRLAIFFSGDLFDFLLPNPRHPFWGSLFAGTTAGYHAGDGGFGLSLGWVAFALFVASSIQVFRMKRGRSWFWGFLVFWTLSLGPVLHVGGMVTGIPLPQAMVAKLLPFLAGSRTPIRYLAPAWVCLAMTVACGWAAARGSWGSRRPTGLESIAAALVLFEALAAPLPLHEVPIPSVYREAGLRDGPGALVHAPALPDREQLLYQAVHGRPLLQDLDTAIPLHSPRPEGPFSAGPWSQALANLSRPGFLESMPPERRPAFRATFLRILREADVRWVAVHRSLPLWSGDLEAFTVVPLMEDEAAEALLNHLRFLGAEEVARSSDPATGNAWLFRIGEAGVR